MIFLFDGLGLRKVSFAGGVLFYGLDDGDVEDLVVEVKVEELAAFVLGEQLGLLGLGLGVCLGLLLGDEF